MTDLEIAISKLADHTLALCKNGELITSDKRGIAPMLEYIRENKDLNGYSAADKVVGKAAAMLFIKAGIKEVYAQTLSVNAQALLSKNGIKACCGELTKFIVNRDKTGMCPMEKAVENIEDIDEGFERLVKRLEEMKSANKK